MCAWFVYRPLSCERCLQATELHPDGGVSVHVLRGAAQHPDRSAQRHLPERTAGRSAGPGAQQGVDHRQSRAQQSLHWQGVIISQCGIRSRKLADEQVL